MYRARCDRCSWRSLRYGNRDDALADGRAHVLTRCGPRKGDPSLAQATFRVCTTQMVEVLVHDQRYELANDNMPQELGPRHVYGPMLRA